jgi:phage tail sheath gpL-like
MAVPIKQIPAALLVPDQYQEIDNSLTGSQGDIKRALMIGYMLSSAPAAGGVPVNVVSGSKAHELFGCGSPAALMAETFLAHNKVEELYVLPIPEPQAGTAWKKKFTTSVTAAVPGAVHVKINGRTFDAAVTSGVSAAAVTAAVIARINSETTLPVLAEADPDDTASFYVISGVKGTAGNNNTVDVTSEASGVTIEEGQTTPGTGVTDIKPFLTALGEVRYNFMASDFDNTENIRAGSDELESRYGALRQIGGRMYIALSGDQRRRKKNL